MAHALSPRPRLYNGCSCRHTLYLFADRLLRVPLVRKEERAQHELRQPGLPQDDRGHGVAGEEPVPARHQERPPIGKGCCLDRYCFCTGFHLMLQLMYSGSTSHESVVFLTIS